MTAGKQMKTICVLPVMLSLLLFSPVIDSCSVVEYGSKISTCWVPYVMEVTEGLLKNIGKPPGPNADMAQEFIASFEASCGDPLDKAISCHKKMDAKCGYRLIAAERTKTAIKSVCTNIGKLIKDTNCIEAQSIATCMRNVKYADDICKVTTDFQKCVKDAFASCNAGMKDIINKGLNMFALEDCATGGETLNSGKQCAGLASLATIGMCYAGPIAKMASVAGVVTEGTPQITVEFKKQCTDGDLNTAIKCHDDVQEKCGIQYVNTVELGLFKDGACANIDRFNLFGDCLSRNTGNAALTCVNAITLTDTSTMLCDMTQTYKACANGNGVFGSCDANLKAFVNRGVDLATLACPRNDPKCTLIEHGATLAMCWYPTVTKLIPWDLIQQSAQGYDMNKLVKSICSGPGKTILDNSMKCHDKADAQCGLKMFPNGMIRAGWDLMCSSDLNEMQKLGGCVRTTSGSDFASCVVKLKDVDTSKDDAMCSVKNIMTGCLDSIMTECSSKIRTYFRKSMSLYFWEVRDCKGKGPDMKPALMFIIASAVLAALFRM